MIILVEPLDGSTAKLCRVSHLQIVFESGGGLHTLICVGSAVVVCGLLWLAFFILTLRKGTAVGYELVASNDCGSISTCQISFLVGSSCRLFDYHS